MLDRNHVLNAYLDAFVDLCEAKTGAVFAIEADRPVLVAHIAINQEALDHTNLTWTVRRQLLEAGNVVRGEPGAALGMRHGGALVGLLYVDTAPDTWDVYQRRTLDLLADVLAHAQRTAPGPALARLDPEAVKREQVLQALRRTAGNVARAARLVGVSRQTFYSRAASFGVNVRKFRP